MAKNFYRSNYKNKNIDIINVKLLNEIFVNETNTPNTSIDSYRLPLTFALFFIHKERLTKVISVQCVVRRVVRVYFL